MVNKNKKSKKNIKITKKRNKIKRSKKMKGELMLILKNL